MAENICLNGVVVRGTDEMDFQRVGVFAEGIEASAAAVSVLSSPSDAGASFDSVVVFDVDDGAEFESLEVSSIVGIRGRR